MAIPHKGTLYQKLEALGVQNVREKLAIGAFSKNKIPLINLWLGDKEKESNDTTKNSKWSARGMDKDILPSWNDIESEYHISKRSFGKKINFIGDDFKRKIIFRDIEQAHFLASKGFYKPAVILAGGVTEELLRLYLDSKVVKPERNTLICYIKACEEHGVLKSAIHKLADSFREFRNLVHLEREESSKHTISRPTAKSAVASIFTIANDFEKEA